MENTEGLDFIDNSSLYFEKNNDLLSPPILKQKFKSKKGQDFSYEIYHTRHSQTRASQRSIDYRTLLTVLHYGTPFPLQHLVFYTIQKGALPHNINKSIKEKTKNLIVVTADNDTTIITCYKSKNAMKHINQKTKTLK